MPHWAPHEYKKQLHFSEMLTKSDENSHIEAGKTVGNNPNNKFSRLKSIFGNIKTHQIYEIIVLIKTIAFTTNTAVDGCKLCFVDVSVYTTEMI